MRPNTSSIMTCVAFAVLVGTVISAAEQAVPKAPAIQVELEDVRLASKVQERLPNPHVSAVLDLRLTNQTASSLWYQVATNLRDYFPYQSDKSIPNIIGIQSSENGSFWRYGGTQYSDSSVLREIKPNRSLVISIRHDIDLRERAIARPPNRYIKVGLRIAQTTTHQRWFGASRSTCLRDDY